jgi:heptaprenyl diphosphate synthase
LAVSLSTTIEDHRIASLAALAIGIHVLESALPSPIPGLKPGFANIVTVVALIHHGWRTAAWIAVLRVLVGSLLLGTFLAPTFIMSAAGAAAGLAALAAGRALPGRGFGPVGFSLVSAVAHMGAQFTAAYFLFVPHPGLLWLLPPLLTAAVVFGVFNGIIAGSALSSLRHGVS